MRVIREARHWHKTMDHSSSVSAQFHRALLLLLVRLLLLRDKDNQIHRQPLAA